MEIATFIERFEAGLTQLESLPLPEARKHYETLCHSFAAADPAGMRVVSDALAGMPVRRFLPAQARPGTVVFLHGGGFTLGSSKSHHGVAASLSWRLAREVVSVDYPLAPQANYATMLSACCRLIKALQPVALVGDSAGGRLVLDAAPRLKMTTPLGLIYPPVNGLSDETLGPSAPLLSREDVLSLSPLCSALSSPESTPLPGHAIEVLAVEHDPLTAPLAREVARWRQQGASIGYRCAPAMVHGALHAHAGLSSMQNAWQEFCQALAARLAPDHS